MLLLKEAHIPHKSSYPEGLIRWKRKPLLSPPRMV